MHRVNEWLSAILKLMLIIVIAVVALWGGVSIYANIAEGDNAGAIPKLLSVEKAEHMFVIKATGECVLTNSFEIISDGNYLLHGYYSAVNGKWKWHEELLPLDEKYFGPITYKRRVT